MIKLYRALVSSRLHYECQIYGLVSSSVMQKLNTIQTTGLHICIGISLSTESLQVEAVELPLYLRREQLTALYHIIFDHWHCLKRTQ